ncbi:MAG: flagellar hook-associated protein FlgK [Hyphomicrobiaceae bacterium]
MSLSAAYGIARQGLATTGTATSIVSRNIAQADNPNASQKIAVRVTDAGGGVRLVGITNAVDNALLERAMESSSARSTSEVLSEALDRLNAAVTGGEGFGGPAALLSDLQSALQVAATSPHDEAAAHAVIAAAKEVVSSLNNLSSLVSTVRADANAQLSEGASRLTGLLNDFATVNKQIVQGAARNQDVTDQVDTRNALMREISDLVDIRTMEREGGDMVLFLANGTTLFETSPRVVSIDAGGLAPGQAGPVLRIDGVPLGDDSAIGGRLGGLLQVRDDAALKFGQQVDEIARGLIQATAEADQSATPTLPDLAGLFTYDGGPALPASGAVVNGLAARIVVNANVDPAQGGDLTLLRDGGISSPGNSAYVYNASGGAGFSGRIDQLIEMLSAGQPFDAATGVGTSADGVMGFAADSIGWLQRLRSNVSDQLETRTVVANRALATWQNRVGVSVDDEMTVLISLERSYQATSRLITTVNGMFDALLRATG